MSATEINDRIEEIYAELDNIEGCNDNPVYARRIRMLRNELTELNGEGWQS